MKWTQDLNGFMYCLHMLKDAKVPTIETTVAKCAKSACGRLPPHLLAPSCCFRCSMPSQACQAHHVTANQPRFCLHPSMPNFLISSRHKATLSPWTGPHTVCSTMRSQGSYQQMRYWPGSMEQQAAAAAAVGAAVAAAAGPGGC